MSGNKLYEEDFHAWALDQAERLHNLGKRGDPAFDGIDFENLHEEILSLARAERREVWDQISAALRSSVMIALWPENASSRVWRETVVTALGKAGLAFTPSMIPHLDGVEIWRDVREYVLEAMVEDGIKAVDLPEQLQIRIEEVLAPCFRAAALIEEVRAAISSARDFRERASRGDPEAALQVLRTLVPDTAPDEGDQIR